jgi:hypothetical protein
VTTSHRPLHSVLALIFGLGFVADAYAENQIILTRDNSTIVLEPYAPNIIRVNLSVLREKATAKPGFGFVASPIAAGWNVTHTSEADTMLAGGNG